MLKLFSAGLLANLLYVTTGVVKQYLIAAQLTVPNVGVFGAWSAQAAFLLVLVPFPAYLSVLIGGFGASTDEGRTGGTLLAGVRRELRLLATVAAVGIACALSFSLLRGELQATPVALLLLLLAQYISLTSDILLRMRQAHRSLATFMAVRNLPTLVLLLTLGLQSPLAVVGAELLSALLTGWLAHRSGALRRLVGAAEVHALSGTRRERTILWSARLTQYANASLLRLLLPFLFDPHVTGLFFFACIAQIPCSLFLSVTTQIFGHALARIERGEWRKLASIQLVYLAPNALYIAAVALIAPHWSTLISYVPKLSQYAEVGPLILVVALYSAVLSSDCQEYLLRSRGLSRVLLQYNIASIVTQIVCLAAGFLQKLAIEYTITLCAGSAAIVLACFSVHSFRLVVGRTSQGPPAASQL